MNEDILDNILGLFGAPNAGRSYTPVSVGAEKARAAVARGESGRVFDWNKAAQIIRERKPQSAAAGLSEDWSYTGGTIYENGAPTSEYYTYLHSLWATPALVLGDDEEVECWVYLNNAPGWDEHTKWPSSALAILEGRMVEGEIIRPLLTDEASNGNA